MAELKIQFITYAIINLFNTFIGLIVWLRYRSEIYRAALVLWVSIVLFFIAMGAINPKTEREILLGCATGWIMFSGIAYFQKMLFNLKMPWVFLAALHCAGLAIALILESLNFPFELKALPVNLTASAPIFVVLFRAYGQRLYRLSFYSALSLASSAAYILYIQTFPFLRMNQDFAPFGFAIGLALTWPLILSVWLTVIEKAQDEKYSLQLRRAALEARINRLRLRQLESRMNPHFLFNALNSILNIIPESAAQAEAAIVQLSAIYRFLSNRSEADLIDFKEEWALVQDYLKIQEMRFGEKFTVLQVKRGNFSAVRIPPLTIQPMVENIFKHVLETQDLKCEIFLSAQEANGSVEIHVRNSGESSKIHVRRSVTLSSIRRRLSHYYKKVQMQVSQEQGWLDIRLTFGEFYGKQR